MTRKFPSSAVDHSLAAKYLTKANRFKVDAREDTVDLLECPVPQPVRREKALG
jgi:hypothetical protein